MKLDQGVGYWAIEQNLVSKYSSVRYNFEAEVPAQLLVLKTLESNLLVRNSSDWTTDVYYQHQCS